MGEANRGKVIKLLQMKQFLSPAIETLKTRAPLLEDVRVEDSLLRILAEDIIPSVNIPENNKAAMDGYAVRSQDITQACSEEPVRLNLLGKQLLASPHNEARIGKDETYQVPTGSSIPLGADAVVKLEQARVMGNEIEISRPAKHWENVELMGEDIKKGKTVLNKGRIIRPFDIGLFIALGRRTVTVFKKPTVGILSVGEELKDPNSVETGKVVNNYAYMIAGLVSEFGAIPSILGITADKLDEIVKTIRSRIDDVDMILTIGGCSVGDKDLVPDAVQASGEPGLLAHGVKVVPLKVSGYGSIRGKPIVMLPGHIVSAVGSFYVFGLPLLNVLCGLDLYSRPYLIETELEEEVQGKAGLGVFKLLRISMNGGRFQAKPLPWGTNRLSYLIRANGFTIIDADATFKKGQMIEAALCRMPDAETNVPAWMK